jgi:hypothetical protein
MAVGGGKPGLTAKCTVINIVDNQVVLQFKDDLLQRPSDYLEVGHEYVVQFLPTPPDNPMGGEGNEGNG